MVTFNPRTKNGLQGEKTCTKLFVLYDDDDAILTPHTDAFASQNHTTTHKMGSEEDVKQLHEFGPRVFWPQGILDDKSNVKITQAKMSESQCTAGVLRICADSQCVCMPLCLVV